MNFPCEENSLPAFLPSTLGTPVSRPAHVLFLEPGRVYVEPRVLVWRVPYPFLRVLQKGVSVSTASLRQFFSFCVSLNSPFAPRLLRSLCTTNLC